MFMLSPRYVLVPGLLTLTLALVAEDAPVAPVTPVTPAATAATSGLGAPVAPGTVVPASNWTFTGRFGAFLANVSNNNAETSRDTTIATSTTSTSFLFSYEGQANWRLDKDSVDNLLKARYGRIRTEGQDWQENNDEVRYDGVYRREIFKPHFVYLGWGAESVFTGPDPYNDAFDPTTGKGSAGYGQRYDDFLLDKNHFEARIGARAQQKWGRSVPDNSDGVETGIEAFARYEQLLKRGNGDYDLRFFGQYEGFSEFNDLEHITNLVTAGLVVQLSKYLAVELGVRAYYETRTKEDDGTGIGYNQWSMRQDALFGLTYAY
jgi:hypothetical protein